MYPKNAASPEPIPIGAVIQISDGAVQPSGCTVRIIPNGVAEGDGGGTTAYSTDGVVVYTPTQAETNYTSFILIAKKTGCIPVSVLVVPTLSPTAGQAVCADTQKVDINTIKTQAVTCGAGVTIRADVGHAGAPGANNGALTTNGTKINQTADLTAGQSIACSDKTGFSLSATGADLILKGSTFVQAIVAAINELATYGLTALNTLLVTTGIKATSIPAANLVDSPNDTALGAIADKILGRSLATGADGGRTVQDALRANRNKVAIADGTMTVYQENDTTAAWTAAVDTAASDPISSVDPT